MTKADELRALADRCEAATGPDRELDVAIGLTGKYFIAESRYPGAAQMIGYVDEDGSRIEPGNGAQDKLVPRYTASLDAAMTLVPEACLLMVRHGRDGATRYGAAYITLYSDDPESWDGKAKGQSFLGSADTLSLALCAASLRALASLEESK